MEEMVMSADEAIVRLSKIARAPHVDYKTPAGPDLITIIEAGLADIIQGFRQYSDGTYSVKFHDSKDALKTILQIQEKLRMVQDENFRVKMIEGVEEMLDKVYGDNKDFDELIQDDELKSDLLPATF